MQHLHLIQQQIANVRSEMEKLWKTREEGKTWDSTQKESYSKLEAKMKELAKERDQRIEFERHIQREKPSAERKFERETDGISIVNLMRALLFKKHGESEFKEDVGRVNEFTREAESQYGSQAQVGSYSIPPRAFKQEPQHQRAALTTTTGSESIVPKVDPTLLDTLYNQSILSKLGVKVIQIPSGTNEYRKVRIDDATTQRSSSKSETADLDERDLNLETEYTLKSDKKLGRWVSVNMNYLRSSAVDPSWIQRMLVQEFSSYFDVESMVGTGTSNRIKGILNNDNVTAVESATNGDALTLKKLTDAVATLLNLNVSTAENLAWVLSPDLANRAENVLAFNVNGSKTIFDKMKEKRVCVSTTMPHGETKGSATKTSSLLLLNPMAVTMAQFGLPQISVNEYASDFWKAGEVGYRIMAYCDLGLQKFGAVHLKNIKETA